MPEPRIYLNVPFVPQDIVLILQAQVNAPSAQQVLMKLITELHAILALLGLTPTPGPRISLNVLHAHQDSMLTRKALHNAQNAQQDRLI